MNSSRLRIKNNYGPWALITGASSGIGKELATQIAESGLNVILVARSENKLNQLAADLKSQYKIETKVLTADLSIKNHVQAVLNETVTYDIGLFVPAAGFGSSGPFIHADIKTEMDMLQVNCAAVTTMTYEFANRFKNREKSGIIFLSSLVSFMGVPNAAHYAASKAYIQSFAEGLAVELKPYGIDVLAAAPGPVASGFGERADMVMNGAMQPKEVGWEILMALGKKTTLWPGTLSKILLSALSTVPRWGKVKIMTKVMGDMTKHQLHQSLDPSTHSIN